MRLPREQLLQFLSPATADAVLASPEDLLRGRRLEVSVLCCDVITSASFSKASTS